MSKKLKIILVLIFAFAIFTIFQKCEANSINKISIDAFVDSTGTAQVTEVWNCNVFEGTEGYHPYYNLGNSTINNLSVSMDNITYKTLTTWDTYNSFENKAYKCGINNIYNGVELCWGISEYGVHNYTIKYTITNFVSTLTDSQMIYWTLIPYNFSPSIGNVYIKIHSNFNISNTIDVWGYGNYGGTANVHDGYIEMKSNGFLSSEQYMTILVKFPSGTFPKNSNNLNNNFNHYLNLANKGSVKYVNAPLNLTQIMNIICRLFIMLFPFIIFFNCIMQRKHSYTRDYNKDKDKIKFNSVGKSLPQNIPYCREIPCNGDLFKAYYIAYQCNILKNKNDLFGAIILKWIKDSLIRIEKKESGTIFKTENVVIILNETNIDSIKNKREQQLFIMLKEASNDGILEDSEFEDWCYSSYNRVLKWFNIISGEQRNNLILEGLIIKKEITHFGIFHHTEYIATPALKDEEIKLVGLKKFLLEYSLIPERTPIEVKIFEEYLVFAQMLGIAKKVSKEFKELYPEVIEQSCYQSFDNIMYLNIYTSDWSSSAYRSQVQAEYLSSGNSSYSSGGGGFSSGGGGGGSFGGGGGGGGFR